MFLNTIGHKNDKVITTALATTSSVGTNAGDKRGKHSPKHKAKQEDTEFMTKHILSYQPQIAHYRHEYVPKRLYLPPELTVREMYSDYVDNCNIESAKCFSYVKYSRKIKELNISFAKLGCEECELCDEHKVHLENSITGSFDKTPKNDRNEMCEELCDKCISWEKHQERYREARKEYEADKELVGSDENTMYLSADMQKVILLPRMPGYKVCLFTKRIVVINQSFAPLKKEDVNKKKSLAIIWHEELKGRNDKTLHLLI